MVEGEILYFIGYDAGPGYQVASKEEALKRFPGSIPIYWEGIDFLGLPFTIGWPYKMGDSLNSPSLAPLVARVVLHHILQPDFIALEKRLEKKRIIRDLDKQMGIR